VLIKTSAKYVSYALHFPVSILGGAGPGGGGGGGYVNFISDGLCTVIVD
jgi:hypothetical protein